MSCVTTPWAMSSMAFVTPLTEIFITPLPVGSSSSRDDQFRLMRHSLP